MTGNVYIDVYLLGLIMVLLISIVELMFYILNPKKYGKYNYAAASLSVALSWITLAIVLVVFVSDSMHRYRHRSTRR